MCDCDENYDDCCGGGSDTMGIERWQPPLGGDVGKPVVGDDVYLDPGLPSPIFVDEIPPIVDDLPVYVDPVGSGGVSRWEPPVVYEPVYTPPVVYEPVYTPPPPVYVDPGVVIKGEPVWEGGPVDPPAPPISTACPAGFTYVDGLGCVQSTRPYEEACPPGYSWHPVSGDCVPANNQPGTVTVTTTPPPNQTPATTPPTTTTNNASPLASLLDADGKLFGFDPLIVGLAAAGVVALFILKD